jgi:hypothetical protein
MDSVRIQAQDTSGMWRTYLVMMNIPQKILGEMRSLQSRYPGYRIRAVDQNDRVVDIL